MLLIMAGFSLSGLLYAKKTHHKQLEWVFKPFTSLLFVITALTVMEFSDQTNSYTLLIFTGLLFGWAGDVLLIHDSKRWFMAGLLIFLLGHIFYIVAFNQLVSFTTLNLIPIIILLLIGSSFFVRLRSKFGKMKKPVLAYIIVISLMVWSALAIYFETDQPQEFRALVTLGAICFYCSDLAVALDRFAPSKFRHFYWGLPLYYAGQLMIALSLGA